MSRLGEDELNSGYTQLIEVDSYYPYSQMPLQSKYDCQEEL